MELVIWLRWRVTRTSLSRATLIGWLVRIRNRRNVIASVRRFIMQIGYRSPLSSFRAPRTPLCRPIRLRFWSKHYAARGKPVGYLLFSGEQHGFRKATTIQRCLEAELHFYAIEVFGVSLTF
jgi:hypothetical protein